MFSIPQTTEPGCHAHQKTAGEKKHCFCYANSMYIHVRLLKGYQQPLTYSLPDSLCETTRVGSIIKVPFRNQTTFALVEAIAPTLDPIPSFTIKSAHTLAPFPNDPAYMSFLKHISAYHQIPVIELVKRMYGFINQKEQRNADLRVGEPDNDPLAQQRSATMLTPAQQQVVDALLPTIGAHTYSPTLLHGVTGSGKTEIYKKLIELE